jgi:hypothetical protein
VLYRLAEGRPIEAPSERRPGAARLDAVFEKVAASVKSHRRHIRDIPYGEWSIANMLHPELPRTPEEQERLLQVAQEFDALMKEWRKEQRRKARKRQRALVVSTDSDPRKAA